jgi:hypothetical protein
MNVALSGTAVDNRELLSYFKAVSHSLGRRINAQEWTYIAEF